MSKKLFDASDESDCDELKINTNKEYAKSYNNFRKKELLKKFKDRGYDVSESGSSSDSDSSSEEDEVLDPKFDQEFFKTLSSLKSKDPLIYDKSMQFFKDLENEENNEETEVKKSKKNKPVTLKDYERKIILENDGKFVDDEDSDAEEERRPNSPTLAEEERNLKAEFKKVVEDKDSSADDEEDAFGGIFKKREKSKEEQDKEDADYHKWLAGKQEDVDETVKEKLKPLKNYWNNEKLPQSERFLRDYILNKGYANAKSSEVPTYDEIVGDNEPLSEDEKELEKQAEFEHKYNFRFEEPDTEFIKRYPRTIENSVRRTDDRRKQKRQEVKERKEQEKAQIMKELEMVKEMKRKEIEDKIQKLKLVTGNDELGFKDEELEDDFDPEAHDRRMSEIFNDDYYQVDEGEEKPECPSDIDELKVEDWDNYDPAADNDDYELHCEDEDFNMDCDYDPAAAKEEFQKELIENTKKRKGRKGRKSHFMEAIKAEKPVFNPEDEKTYEEYIDEYYKLDCEDVIGDIPCRFKYVETTPNDFGLTIEEILLAKNKELNQWASLKKAIQMRPDHVEKKDQRLYKMKAKNEALKRKIFKSLYGDGSDEEDAADEEDDIVGESKVAQNAIEHVVAEGGKKSKKKKKRKVQNAQSSSNTDAVTPAKTELETPAKKPKSDDGNIKAEVQPTLSVEKTNEADNPEKNKKKRKKRKNKSGANAGQNQINSSSAQNAFCVVATKTTGDANITNMTTEHNKSVQHNKPNPFSGPKKDFHKSTPKQNNSNASNAVNKSNPFVGAAKTMQNEGQKTANASQNKTNPFAGTKVAAVNGESKTGQQQKKNPFKNGTNQKLNRETNQNGVRRHKGNFKAKFGKFNNKNTNFKGKNADATISDDRLKAYGINPKKFHKKQKYGNAQGATA